MFTHGGGNTLINLGSGITQKTTSCAVAHPLTRLGQTMECSLSQTWGKSVCFYFSFLLLSVFFFVIHPLTLVVQGMENQIFWSQTEYLFQVACCTLPPELPES